MPVPVPPPFPAGVGSLKATIDALSALLAGVHPSLNVYRWWRPDMALPAVWLWMTPGDVRTDGVPVCRTVDVLRITVSVGVDPTAVAGEGDMLEIEAYVDLVLQVLDPELYGRHPLGQRLARRRGFQTVADRLGDASILALELPIEVELHHDVQPTP
jgi:hypothetical protein